MRQAGFFGLSKHLEQLSKHGDPLEVLEATVDFEHFRPWLVAGLGYGDSSKGGRPPSSMSSHARKRATACSSAPSAWRGPRQN